MYIRIRNCSNFEEFQFSIVKSATIAQLKKEIEKNLAIKSELQRLYFSGKHLEKENTLYDYKIKKNDVIQLMIKSDDIETENLNSSKVDTNKNDFKYKKEKKKDSQNLVDATSDYYNIGDAVDCIDLKYGAWFEATITRICYKDEILVYFVKWDLIDNAQPFQVSEKSIRPRAHRIISEKDLLVGQKVMINHNLDNPSNIGHWYDFEIKKILTKKDKFALFGTLFIGNNADSHIHRTINLINKVYAIEKPKPLKDRNQSDCNLISNVRRIVAPECSQCFDKINVKCKECGCKVCGGKDNPDRILLCDECEDEYHIDCLKPPFSKVPDDDWYCPKCKNDENEIVKMGEQIQRRSYQKVRKVMKNESNRSIFVKERKIYPIVQKNHRGPIPGIEVGSCWWNRIELAEDRVHVPPMAGIHGRENDCAYSIILSGGYGDIDNGIEFIYTGSGGRDGTGSKQSSHQTLTRANKALALNCKAKFNDQEGATATDWRAGIPVRVIRSYKLAKYSIYAPSEGNRYDGLYKVVKYYPEYNEDGFRLWRYLLRRDDPLPPPWTPEGKKRIIDLGLKMRYPDNYVKKVVEKPDKQISLKSNVKNVKEIQQKKKQKIEPYKLDSNVSELIDKDNVNFKLWQESKTHLTSGKICFLNQVSKSLQCVCCQELVFKPVTTPCAHNICQSCLKKSLTAGVNCCPTCRFRLKKNLKLSINKDLAMILILLFPGYERGRK